jgi:hypothetical protein
LVLIYCSAKHDDDVPFATSAEKNGMSSLGHTIDAVLMLGPGVFLLLAAFGKAKVSKTEEGNRKWREKYGTLALICGCIVTIGGVSHLVRIFA